MSENNNKTKNQPNLPSDFVEEIKRVLLERKQKLERELSVFADRDQRATEEDFSSRFPNYGEKDDENAAEVAEYAANISIEEKLEKVLRDINKTLERMADGTYGICKYCKKPIALKRLEARPTSSACVECKKTIIQEV